MDNISLLILYFVAINFSLYIQMNVDKTRKYFKGPRISEFILLLLAFGGGAIGGTLSMWTNKHKLNKWYFKNVLPILALFDLYVLYIIFTM